MTYLLNQFKPGNILEKLYLPNDLNSVIGSERTDFADKAKHAQPRKSITWTNYFQNNLACIYQYFCCSFSGPLFVGQEVEFTTNGVPTVAGTDNLGPIMLPALLQII